MPWWAWLLVGLAIWTAVSFAVGLAVGAIHAGLERERRHRG